MPHVSSQKLSSSFQNKLFNKLIKVLGRTKNEEHLSLIFNELFTSIEKVMFTKRLAIVLMLANNIPQHRIVKILKVSPTTVAKTSLRVEVGEYNNVLKTSKKEKVDIEKIVWNILTAGGFAPPIVGRRYWKKYIYKK